MVDVYRTPGTGPDRPTAAYRAMCRVARRLLPDDPWRPVDGMWVPWNPDDGGPAAVPESSPRPWWDP
jgi:hypothetical protein